MLAKGVLGSHWLLLLSNAQFQQRLRLANEITEAFIIHSQPRYMNEISNCSIKKCCSNHGDCGIICLYFWILFQISKCRHYLESCCKVSLCLNICLRCDLPYLTRWMFVWCIPYTNVFVYYEAGTKKAVNDIIMSTRASQIISHTIVYSTVYSGADQGKHQSSASQAFVRGIHWWPVISPHKGPVTRKMFPLDDVIMRCFQSHFPTNIVIIRPRFPWNLLPGVQLTIAQNWHRKKDWQLAGGKPFSDLVLNFLRCIIVHGEKISILVDMSDVCA